MANKEKLDKIEEKINQLKAQKQALLAKEKEKERKARTRRLIQIGAIIESMGIDDVELAAKFKATFENNNSYNNWLNDFIEKNNIRDYR